MIILQVETLTYEGACIALVEKRCKRENDIAGLIYVD